jgi:protocatechuate 3,4-dioxygenase beta subunit
VWHCDAGGLYSDESANGTSGKKYLRGYQITDANGVVNFTTVYPGWYGGRAVHVHFKLRLFAGAAKTYEFTSQFFFDESLTSTVHAVSPYSSRGTRNTVNTTDGIYNSLSAAQKSALTLQATKTTDGYAGIITLGVQVG